MNNLGEESVTTRDPLELPTELLRKGFHLVVLIFPIAHRIFLIHPIVIFLFWLSVSFIVIPLELVRIRWKSRFTDALMRTEERQKGFVAGYVYTYFTWLLLLGFGAIGVPFYLVEAALCTAVLGDGAAAIIGKWFPYHRLPGAVRKTWEGFFAGVIVSLITFFVLTLYSSPIALAMAIICAALMGIIDSIEGLPLPFTDNVLGPLVLFWMAFTMEAGFSFLLLVLSFLPI